MSLSYKIVNGISNVLIIILHYPLTFYRKIDKSDNQQKNGCINDDKQIGIFSHLLFL